MAQSSTLFDKLAQQLGLWDILFKFYHFNQNKYIMGMFEFHRVTNTTKTKHCLTNYDIGLDVKMFEKQIEIISKYFNFISYDDYLKVVTGEKELTGHSAILSFDDADIDFVDYPLPVIKKFNATSVVFAPTAFIETDDKFWLSRLDNSLLKMDQKQWHKIKELIKDEFDDIAESLINLKVPNHNERSLICKYIGKIFSKKDDRIANSFMDKLENITGEDFQIKAGFLDWTQIQKLDSENIRFESHTHNHYKLIYINDDEILTELQLSKNRLESKLQRDITSICYPDGDYNNRVIEIARDTGYKIGITTDNGSCRYPQAADDLFKLSRVVVYGNDEIEMHRSMARIAKEAIKGTKQ